MEIKMREVRAYNVSPMFWSSIIMSLIALAFVLSDWLILYSSFGDFILALAVLILFLVGRLEIDKHQMNGLLTVFGLLLLTIVLSYLFNDYWVNPQRIVVSSIKFMFYIISLVVFYNFLNHNKLLNQFLRINNRFAMVVILLGILITIGIYLDNRDLATFLWRFTRDDYRSFYFAGNAAIVRTRSIFSEPAHLGYYLNTLYFANLFSKRKSNKLVLSIMALGILLTFSYSMIIIFFLTNTVAFVYNIIKGDWKWSKWYSLLLIPLVILFYFLWDMINETIIQRTLNILNGTDTSAYNRLVESWIYVERERLLFGNGIGHTPPVTNIYAYALSDFGLIGLIPYIGLSIYLLILNLPAFTLFVTMNVAKGGYLNPAFWLFLLMIFLYGFNKEN